MGDGERPESRLPEEVVMHALARSVGNGGAAIQPASTKVQCKEMLAVGRLTGFTLGARAAGQIGDGDWIARLERPYRRADLLDDTCALMAQHARQRRRKILLPNDMVRMADTGSCHPDEHLLRPGGRERQVLNCEWTALCANDGALKITGALFSDCPIPFSLFLKDHR